MQFYSILTILPSGVHDILTVPENYIDMIINNRLLTNCSIGPIVNPNDLEKGELFHIHCMATTDKTLCTNIPFTHLMHRCGNNNLDVDGQVYIIKKIEQNYDNINKEDASIIFDILNDIMDLNISMRRADRIKMNEEITSISNFSLNDIFTWMCR